MIRLTRYRSVIGERTKGAPMKGAATPAGLEEQWLEIGGREPTGEKRSGRETVREAKRDRDPRRFSLLRLSAGRIDKITRH